MNIREMIDYSEKGILSKAIRKSAKLDITLFCMAKGTELSEHTSTRPGFVYVIEGSGVFVLEKEPIAMAPGVLIFMDADAVHSLKAEENTSFILALVR